jgi:CubicO group peptidase (beta-lactamase class C family)
VSCRSRGADVRWRRGGRRLAGAALIWLLLAACSTPGLDSRPTPEASPSAVAVPREYWPTAGWRTAAPKDHGMDPAALAAIEDQVPKAYSHVRSFLLVRHGHLVYEHYWRGLDQTSGHDVRSVTKSVIGALVGIALAEGKLKSLDQTVGELLAAQLPKDADPRFAGVTVRHLLTMTSGLASDESDPGIRDAMVNSHNWVRHILSRRVETEPGTHFAYSDAGAHLLSVILTEVSGQPTLTFAREKLFTPLGIPTNGAFEPELSSDIDPEILTVYERASVAWPVDPQGYHYGAALLRLPSRDLAKIGYLYLNGGRWDGNQLIPADYVAASTSPAGSGPNLAMGYAWLWWVGSERDRRTFFAQGYGGQFIYVVPHLDLVAVITSEPEAQGLNPKTLITQTVLRAVTA